MLLNLLLIILSLLLVAAAVTQHVLRRILHVLPNRILAYAAYAVAFIALWRINSVLFANRVEGIWSQEGKVLTAMGALLIVATLGFTAALVHHAWLRYIARRQKADPRAFMFL